jgi:hypothetical protein
MRALEGGAHETADRLGCEIRTTPTERARTRWAARGNEVFAQTGIVS